MVSGACKQSGKDYRQSSVAERNTTMAEQALLIKMRPKFQELRDARLYDEEGVKRILYKFACQIGCKWSDAKLNLFIERMFDFD